ncbi:MAG: hypothetical protein HY000_09095 [Planctomycetes bacterium]|nr:hypothetical protein [Planctomycetota bacterium]
MSYPDSHRPAVCSIRGVCKAPVIGQAIKTNIPYLPASWIRDNYRHSPQIEAPEEMAQLICEFIERCN